MLLLAVLYVCHAMSTCLAVCANIEFRVDIDTAYYLASSAAAAVVIVIH